MDNHSNDDGAPGARYAPTRRSFLAAAMAAGLGGTAIAGLTSILPMRAFAKEGASAGTVTYGNAEPPTSNYWDRSAPVRPSARAARSWSTGCARPVAPAGRRPAKVTKSRATASRNSRKGVR